MQPHHTPLGPITRLQDVSGTLGSRVYAGSEEKPAGSHIRSLTQHIFVQEPVSAARARDLKVTKQQPYRLLQDPSSYLETR